MALCIAGWTNPQPNGRPVIAALGEARRTLKLLLGRSYLAACDVQVYPAWLPPEYGRNPCRGGRRSLQGRRNVIRRQCGRISRRRIGLLRRRRRRRTTRSDGMSGKDGTAGRRPNAYRRLRRPHSGRRRRESGVAARRRIQTSGRRGESWVAAGRWIQAGRHAGKNRPASNYRRRRGETGIPAGRRI